MARAAFVDDKEQVAKILRQIGDNTVRVFEAPASYYKMRKLEDLGYVKHARISELGHRGHLLTGFALAPKGKMLLAKQTGSKRRQNEAA